jgi:short-subunit dehydrogenase
MNPPMERAVVTGGSSGIGREIALGLAALGLEVFVIGRDEERLARMEQVGGSQGARVRGVAIDLMDDVECERRASSRLPEELDVLVHAAGVVDLAPVASASMEAVDRNLQLHYRAPLRLTQILLPGLRRRQGQVVFVNSGAGHRTAATWVPYAAAKHAMKSLTEGLREEERAHGVRVIGVYPGRVATPMQERVRALEEKPYDPAEFLDPRDVAEPVIQALRSSRRVGTLDVAIRP